MKQLIILGGGYSIKEGIEKGLWDKIKGRDVWSLNFAYEVMPFLPTKELWIDINFFKNHISELQTLSNLGVKLGAKAHSQYNDIPEIIQYHTSRNLKDYNEINKGKVYFIGQKGLCGFLGLSVGLSELYNEIYLLGYDFGTTGLNDKNTHFYQENTSIHSVGIGRPDIYRDENNIVIPEVKDFEVYLKEINTKIYNVSLNSNIQCFEKLSWEDFFKKLL
jgi:hypothetical protein